MVVGHFVAHQILYPIAFQVVKQSPVADWFMEGGKADIIINAVMSGDEDNTFFYQKWSAALLYYISYTQNHSRTSDS